MNILLAVVLIVSFILRLISLNQSFWLDEAVGVWASSSFSLKDFLLKYLPGDFNPPFYHFLLMAWLKVFSGSEAQVRLLSVILGVAGIYFFHRILRELGMKKSWLTALFLLSTSPLHLYYSQEARMYILGVFGFLLALWRFLIFEKKKTVLNSLILGISFLIMGFSHFLTLLSLPIFFFWGLVFEKKAQKKDWILFFLPFIILILGYLAYWPLLLSQLRVGLGWQKEFPVWGQTVGSFTLKAAALLLIKFIIGRISFSPAWLYGLIAVFLILIYWGWVLKGIRVRKAKRFLLFGLLFFPPFLGFLLSFRIAVFSYFRFLFVLPLFYLLIARGLEPLKKRSFQFWSILLISLNLIFSGLYLFNPLFQREDWRGMVSYLQSQNRYFDAPIIILPQIEKPFLYYDRGKSRRIAAGEAKEAVVFLISYGLPIFDPNDKIRNTLREKDYFPAKGESFNQVGIEIWRKK